MEFLTLGSDLKCFGAPFMQFAERKFSKLLFLCLKMNNYYFNFMILGRVGEFFGVLNDRKSKDKTERSLRRKENKKEPLYRNYPAKRLLPFMQSEIKNNVLRFWRSGNRLRNVRLSVHRGEARRKEE